MPYKPTKFDPQLLALMTVADSLDDRERPAVRRARSSLYRALADGQWLAAKDWLNALDAALLRVSLDERTRELVDKAIDDIRDGLRLK